MFDISNIMVPSMVHKIQMETVFDKIFANLNFVSDILLYRNGIYQMLSKKYRGILILDKNQSEK